MAAVLAGPRPLSERRRVRWAGRATAAEIRVHGMVGAVRAEGLA
ncbi:hypothetical protein RB200_06770 [Streptomyces sp. PmtG]